MTSTVTRRDALGKAVGVLLSIEDVKLDTRAMQAYAAVAQAWATVAQALRDGEEVEWTGRKVGER